MVTVATGGDGVAAVIDHAARLMLEAKRNGKNKVVAASMADQPSLLSPEKPPVLSGLMMSSLGGDRVFLFHRCQSSKSNAVDLGETAITASPLDLKRGLIDAEPR